MQAIKSIIRSSAYQGIGYTMGFFVAGILVAGVLWFANEYIPLHQHRIIWLTLELGSLVFLLLSFFTSIASKYFRVDKAVLLLGLGCLMAALLIFYDLLSNLLNRPVNVFLTDPLWWTPFVALAPPIALYVYQANKPHLQQQRNVGDIVAIVLGWLVLGGVIGSITESGTFTYLSHLILIFVYAAITVWFWRNARQTNCMVMLALMLCTLMLLVPAHQGHLHFALLAAIFHVTASFALYRMVFAATIRQPYYQIQQIMSHDGLTGLLSRAAFKQLLEDRLTRTTSQQPPFSVIQVGLDRFKSVNALLGHEHGDLLLMAVAQRLVSHLPENTRLSRFSGDNFMIFLPDCNTGQAKRTSHLLLSALSDEFDLAIDNITISASLGVVVHPNDGNSVSLLLRRADMALHQAKAQGGNCVRLFNQELSKLVSRKAQLETALVHALGNNELQLHYQPKVCIANGKLIGWEALMRWQSPEFGQVSPVEFIPVAEETGLILALGQWALEETCRQVSCWRAMGLNTGSVAVNLSARQFRQRDLPEQISLLLAKHRLPASTITLEITESAIMDDPVVVAEMLNHLESKGIYTAVDDFGTGHSSLSYLKNLPIHSLKIDRSFIKDIPDDENSVAIVHVILSLARSLGLFVIAEGVETQAQFEYLRKESCNAMQGYIFSRPLPAQECISLMEKYSDTSKS